MVAVTVAGDHHLPWPSVALLNDNLMSDTATGGVKVNPMLLGKCFNLPVLGEIRGRLVLYIMVEGEDRLPWIVKTRAGEGKEFGDDRSGVIVSHPVECQPMIPLPHSHMLWSDHEIVPRADFGTRWEIDRILLNNLLDQSLRVGYGCILSAKAQETIGSGERDATESREHLRPSEPPLWLHKSSPSTMGLEIKCRGLLKRR